MKIKIIGILCILSGLSLIIYSSTSILSEDIIKEETKKENEKIIIEKENVNRNIEDINDLEEIEENEEEITSENIIEEEIVIKNDDLKEKEDIPEFNDELILDLEENK